MMSDDSENDGAYVESGYENDVYYKKYKFLLEECEAIQKNNERLVYRIEEVKKITKCRSDQVQLIRDRLLKKYGEDWRDIPHRDIKLEEVDVKPFVPLNNAIKEEIKQEPEEVPLVVAPPPPPAPTPPVKPTKKAPVKRKSGKSEKDPNAPKRPSNPFFQFCQDQRQIMMEKLASDLKPGEVEPSKQELTRQLAIKWKSLSTLDKQIYVDMYERSKEKYAVEMSEYKSKI